MYSNHHINKRREHKSSECSCSIRPPPKGVYKNPSYSYTNLNNIDSDVDFKLPLERAYNKMSRCVSHIETPDTLSWFETDRLNKPGKLRDSQDNYSLPPLELTYRQETCFVIKKTPERRHHTSLLSENGNSSLNLNCKHYCSTYYKREQPEYSPYYTESTQKNISRLMASVKNYVDEISENKFKDMDIRDDEYSSFQYGEGATNAQYSDQLRERKTKNNNISPCYGQDSRPMYTDNGYANDNGTFSATNIHLSGYNSSELSLPNETGLKESKRSPTKNNRFAPIQSSDIYDLDTSNSWIDISNNNVEEETRQQKATYRKRTENAAKKSPTSHRVLLYGNQSPILSRLSPMKKQEYKKLSIRSFELKKGTKRWNVEEENSYVRFSRSDSPEDYEGDSNNVLNRGKIESKYDGYYETTLSDDDTADSCDSGRSSDSEDGYRSNAYKFAHLLGSPDTTQTYHTADKSEVNLKNPPALLVPSLFPNVPPYIAFSSSLENGPFVTPELHRVLKWKVTNVMPKVVRSVLVNSGMRLVKKTNDWMGTWGKHMKSPCFKAIRPYQKVNHLPGSFKIGRKDSCWKNLQKQMCKYGKKDYGFMPKTYVIPHDLKMLRKNWPRYSQRSLKWIIKPPASARGTGIRVVDRWAQIPKRRPLIVQKYIERPLLINGSKFDLRLYVLVTSINPLRVYMYDNGLVRFASVKYSDKSDTLHDRCMHLTNYSINKLSLNYSKNDDVNACHGHKWTIHSLWSYLENRGIRTDCLWKALQNLVLRTLIAGEHSINNMIKMNVESKYSCFELFGFDVLLDAELIPWLLEVNISPSLHSELPLDAHVKAPLIQGVLNTALYNVPPKLSMEKQREISVAMSLPPGPICFDKRIYINNLSRSEKIKHSIFTRRSLEDREEYINEILINLTPDDVRCLIVAEDELARSAPLQRIFPTTETHKYLKYTEAPRYYNRLLDAWESRYGNNRNEGIEYLRKFCEEKYHLEIPPSPVKKFSFSREAFA